MPVSRNTTLQTCESLSVPETGYPPLPDAPPTLLPSPSRDRGDIILQSRLEPSARGAQTSTINHSCPDDSVQKQYFGQRQRSIVHFYLYQATW